MADRKSRFTVDQVYEILDRKVSDEELAKKFNVTTKQIRVKRYHLAGRNNIRTSSDFKAFLARSTFTTTTSSQNEIAKEEVAKTEILTKTEVNTAKNITGDDSLLEIMDTILDDFGKFEKVCKTTRDKIRRDSILNNQVSMLERLLDRGNVLLARLINRDLAFFSAMSSIDPKEIQDDYLTRLGFTKNDIEFYRNHSTEFEVQEDAK